MTKPRLLRIQHAGIAAKKNIRSPYLGKLMRYLLILALLLVQFCGSGAYGSLSESEPNSTVIGTNFSCNDCPERYMVEIGNSLDPSQANLLPLNDEIVGQLNGTRDYDWFYLDVPDASRPVTPVYFGCDQKQGYYQETAPGNTLTVDPATVTYQVDYYYGTATGIELQSSYVVGPNSCKQGTAETIGHMRFQMNTQRPGRYYVRIFGRHIDVKEVDDTVKDSSGNSFTRKTFYDEIITPTGDYSLRVYTARVSGEQEPNDGSLEAYPLISGTAATGQLSTMYDQDWFYIDNDISVNTSQKIPFYFTCAAQAGIYNLSAYDYLGVLQASYQISANQCSRPSGFSFFLNAPISARYYFVVSPPTYTDTTQFTQADYTVLAIASPNSPLAGTPTRLPGQPEPNDTLINAYPLTDNQPVTGAQISSVEDLDYYYYDNNSANNPSGTIPIYFQCTAPAESGAIYVLSSFDPLGTLQKSYTVDASQCNVPGGFKFQMNTPSNARYYVLVAENSSNFSTADYTLSTSYILNGETSGKLNTANIASRYVPAAKDNFAIKIGQCGTRKGIIKLTGKRLNLTGIDPHAQINVKIGSWSCVSDPKTLTIDTSSPARKILVYPQPVAPPAPPPKRTQISGRG